MARSSQNAQRTPSTTKHRTRSSSINQQTSSITIQILPYTHRNSQPPYDESPLNHELSFTLNLLPTTSIRELRQHAAEYAKSYLQQYLHIQHVSQLSEARDNDGCLFWPYETVREVAATGSGIVYLSERRNKDTLQSLRKEDLARQAGSPTKRQNEVAKKNRKTPKPPRKLPSQRALEIASSGARSNKTTKRASMGAALELAKEDEEHGSNEEEDKKSPGWGVPPRSSDIPWKKSPSVTKSDKRRQLSAEFVFDTTSSEPPQRYEDEFVEDSPLARKKASKSAQSVEDVESVHEEDSKVDFSDEDCFEDQPKFSTKLKKKYNILATTREDDEDNNISHKAVSSQQTQSQLLEFPTARRTNKSRTFVPDSVAPSQVSPQSPQSNTVFPSQVALSISKTRAQNSPKKTVESKPAAKLETLPRVVSGKHHQPTKPSPPQVKVDPSDIDDGSDDEKATSNDEDTDGDDGVATAPPVETRPQSKPDPYDIYSAIKNEDEIYSPHVEQILTSSVSRLGSNHKRSASTTAVPAMRNTSLTARLLASTQSATYIPTRPIPKQLRSSPQAVQPSSSPTDYVAAALARERAKALGQPYPAKKDAPSPKSTPKNNPAPDSEDEEDIDEFLKHAGEHYSAEKPKAPAPLPEMVLPWSAPPLRARRMEGEDPYWSVKVVGRRPSSREMREEVDMVAVVPEMGVSFRSPAKGLAVRNQIAPLVEALGDEKEDEADFDIEDAQEHSSSDSLPLKIEIKEAQNMDSQELLSTDRQPMPDEMMTGLIYDDDFPIEPIDEMHEDDELPILPVLADESIASVDDAELPGQAMMPDQTELPHLHESDPLSVDLDIAPPPSAQLSKRKRNVNHDSSDSEEARREQKRLRRAERKAEKKRKREQRRAERAAGRELLEQQRIEKDHIDQQRLEQERLEQESHRQECLEQKRLEKERAEKERLAQDQRLEELRMEMQRIEKQRLKEERTKQELLEQERVKQERLELERIEQEQKQREAEDVAKEARREARSKRREERRAAKAEKRKQREAQKAAEAEEQEQRGAKRAANIARLEEERKRLALEDAHRRAKELEIIVSSPLKAAELGLFESDDGEDSELEVFTPRAATPSPVGREHRRSSMSPTSNHINSSISPIRHCSVSPRSSSQRSVRFKKKDEFQEVQAAPASPSPAPRPVLQKATSFVKGEERIGNFQRPVFDEWAFLEATLGRQEYSPLEVHNRVHLNMVNAGIQAVFKSDEEISHDSASSGEESAPYKTAIQVDDRDEDANMVDSIESDEETVRIKREPGLEDSSMKAPFCFSEVATGQDTDDAATRSMRSFSPSPDAAEDIPVKSAEAVSDPVESEPHEDISLDAYLSYISDEDLEMKDQKQPIRSGSPSPENIVETKKGTAVKQPEQESQKKESKRRPTRRPRAASEARSKKAKGGISKERSKKRKRNWRHKSENGGHYKVWSKAKAATKP